jgi:hypothetical protein
MDDAKTKAETIIRKGDRTNNTITPTTVSEMRFLE